MNAHSEDPAPYGSIPTKAELRRRCSAAASVTGPDAPTSKLISALGGHASFTAIMQRLGITTLSRRTAESWESEARRPPPYVRQLIHQLFKSWSNR